MTRAARSFAFLLGLLGCRAFAAALAQDALPEAEAPRGTLVILGGAVKDDHHALWQAVVDAAGGAGRLVLVLPTASGDPERSGEQAAQQLRRRGARAEVLPIAPHWSGGNAEQARAQASDPAWAQRVAAADGLFMTGGDQARLIDVLRPGGRETPLLAAIRALHRRGGVVAGTSAGATVMSETAIQGLDDPFTALLRPLDGNELAFGFGLLPHDIVCDQHFLRRGRIARLVRVLLQSGRPLGLGVDENSAARVQGSLVQALGARGLLVVDASRAQVEAVVPLQVQGLRVSYVDAGDRFDLAARRVLPAPSRAPLALPERAGAPVFFGDMLGDGLLVGAMAQAAEGPTQGALGLAWRLPERTAFEWQLRRDARTRAWAGSTGDEISIEALRVDIRPVRMAQPPYEAVTR